MVVVHMVGLRISRGITRIMGRLGFMVDSWERCPLLRYHTRTGEKVSLGAIAGRIVQRVIKWRSRDLSGGREGELMVRIERISRGGRLGNRGGVKGRTIVREKEGIGKAIRAEA